LWLGVGLAAWGCKNQDKLARKSAIDFLPAKLSLGEIEQNQPARASIDLQNSSASEVHLRAQPSSGRCRWQGLPAAIAPHTTVQLSVACQSDLLGPLAESLTVLDATQGGVLAALPIEGRVEPAIGFDTAYVDLRPGFGDTASADVHLIGRQAATARPSVTSTGGDVVTATALRSDGGRVWGFRLSCTGDRVGMHAGSMLVDTGVVALPALTLSWGCRVPATLQVEPATPYFNLHTSGDRATKIVVRSSQAGFVVKSARVVEGPFRATLEKPTPDGSTPITVRVQNERIPDEARAATGKLLIESNDQREPRKEVPLFGFGKVTKAVAP
jgi:hypothetical protein